MGRHLSNAPQSPAAARAYLVQKWTDPVLRHVDSVSDYCAHVARRSSAVAALNDRLEPVWQLHELLRSTRGGLPRAMRSVAALAEAAEGSSAELEVAVHGGDPAGDAVAVFLSAASEYQDSFRRLQAATEALSGKVAICGAPAKIMTIAAALGDYGKFPRPASRRVLAAALRPSTLEDDRTALVRTVECAIAEMRGKTATEWAHYSIHAKIEPPCNSAVVNGARRESWREVLHRARR